MEPRTVIIPARHGLIGPSSIWDVGEPGGPHTAPPGLGALGAAQPARASSKFLSLRIGLGTSAPFTGTRHAPTVAKSIHRQEAREPRRPGSHAFFTLDTSCPRLRTTPDAVVRSRWDLIVTNDRATDLIANRDAHQACEQVLSGLVVLTASVS
jgi:hypothetical protein